MEIDFHFAVTYILGRLAGFKHDSALTVATSAQYVDDTVSEGTIRFSTGQRFRRISTAHEFLNPKIALSEAERLVWVPFHFLPAGEGSKGSAKEKFSRSIVCKPNSEIAQKMLELCIRDKGSPSDLHRLGITAHVFVDTWAHQGFVGMNSALNRASKVEFLNFKRSKNRLIHLKRALKSQGLFHFLSRLWYVCLSKMLSRVFPMGHGAVLHYPDWPFLEWSYINDKGMRITRDNPTDFLNAADELYKFFVNYEKGKSGKTPARIPSPDRELIEEMLRTLQDEEGEKRCQSWIKAIGAGKFSFGAARIHYYPKGLKSWKYDALGTRKTTDHFWQRFEFTPSFLKSDWKLFHDAALSHQHCILHEILPEAGVCVT
jgi:hypothetical protein